MSTKPLRWWVRVFDRVPPSPSQRRLQSSPTASDVERLRWRRRYVNEVDARQHAAALRFALSPTSRVDVVRA